MEQRYKRLDVFTWSIYIVQVLKWPIIGWKGKTKTMNEKMFRYLELNRSLNVYLYANITEVRFHVNSCNQVSCWGKHNERNYFRLKTAWSFIWTILNPVYRRMCCFQPVWIWLICPKEEEESFHIEKIHDTSLKKKKWIP